MENEGVAIRLWPITSTVQAAELLSKEAEYGSGYDIIVSNKSVSRPMRRHADSQGWGIMHYSEMYRFIKEYWLGLFEDSGDYN